VIRIEDEFQIPSSIRELIKTIYKLILNVRRIYTNHIQKILTSFGIFSTPQSDDPTEEMIAHYMDLDVEYGDDPSGNKGNKYRPKLWDSVLFKTIWEDEDKFKDLNWKILLKQERGQYNFLSKTYI
jgi:hypothetical protein